MLSITKNNSSFQFSLENFNKKYRIELEEIYAFSTNTPI